MQHSNIVGGSTAKRVINCPGSVALVAKMPPQPSSSHADQGTLLHNAVSAILEDQSIDVINSRYKDQVLTQDLYDEKIMVGLSLLDQVDPDKKMEYEVETRVNFGDLLPGVFGSTDLMGRIGNKAIILDWKFGAGVAVPAEENDQLLFYAAAAMRTPEAQWVFDGATEVELIIIQPPAIKRWTTTRARIEQFERDLVKAVKLAEQPDAPIKHGDHCRWCRAKPICPVMNGAVDRAIVLKMDNIDVEKIGAYLHNADLLEAWIKDLRALAEEMLKKGKPISGWKMVPKRATRQWVKEEDAVHWLDGKGLEPKDIYSKELLSPAQMEKVLKKSKLTLPPELVVAVSSGTTIAPESDPRPAVVLIGQQLNAALTKLM